MAKGKKNSNLSILKKLERHLSMKKGSSTRIFLSKSKLWHNNRTTNGLDDKDKSKSPVTPQGCFSVCVWPEKERFIIKTKFANHPLFNMLLLEDAGMEYGYNSQGPILLPCDINLFYRVLGEMDSDEKEIVPGLAYVLCSPFSPARRLRNEEMANGTLWFLWDSQNIKVALNEQF